MMISLKRLHIYIKKKDKKLNLFSLLLPLAFQLVKGYINSTDSKKDDHVLDIVKKGVCYLEAKDNNDVNSLDMLNILDKKIIKK